MTMGYAVRTDGQGWRAVAGADDIGSQEWFSSDVPPEPVPFAPDLRDNLLVIASNRMGPLQDAVDEGVATDDEVARLKLWKHYRIDLNRIEQQTGYPTEINWPSSPDDIVLHGVEQ